jgi:hypothetical protein
MRIPAVAIAAAFSGGILLGRGLHLTRRLLKTSFPGIFFLLTAALLVAWRERLWPAAFFFAARMGVSRRAGDGYDFAAAAGGARFEPDCGGG